MDIYVVQPGDNIEKIAAKYGMSAEKLIQDNGFVFPDDLVPGQTIVIAYPTQVHSVKDGDTLDNIAKAYGVSVLQLLRNNPFLSEREYIYPGETLVISYNTGRKISTNGFAFPYINQKILIRTLPYLTYLTIYNYKADTDGDITAFYDDTELIRISKQYGVIPLMLITSLSAQGDMDLQSVYKILSDEEAQDRLIDNAVNIIKTKGYNGVNLTFSFVNSNTLHSYEKLLEKVFNRSRQEGYYVFVTINPAITEMEEYEKVDYSVLARLSDNLVFIHFVWGTNLSSPTPVSSISAIKDFLDYVTPIVPSAMIDIGMPTIGYDWVIQNGQNKTIAHSLSLDAAVNLARNTDSTIQFDEKSQTPFFLYTQPDMGSPIRHIVWFIDARSIDALMDLVVEYGLAGTGVWNIMTYYNQLWLVINSQYEIETLLQ